MYESASLTPATLDTIAQYAARATWPLGFAVYRRGATANGVFIVLQGRVALRSRVKPGRGYIPTTIGRGGTFGGEGLAAATPYPPRYVTEAFSDADSETLHLGAAQHRALVREQPASALALMAQVMAEHATLLERLRELATLSVEQRLLASLVRMARQHTALDSCGRFALDTVHCRVLCEVVGATRETVAQVLNRLIASGAAEWKDGCVRVHPDTVSASSDPTSAGSFPVVSAGAAAADTPSAIPRGVLERIPLILMSCDTAGPSLAATKRRLRFTRM
jgi:CRP-like cAMP-binding protein